MLKKKKTKIELKDLKEGGFQTLKALIVTPRLEVEVNQTQSQLYKIRSPASNKISS